MDLFYSLLLFFLPVSQLTDLNRVKANRDYIEGTKKIFPESCRKKTIKQWASVLFTTVQNPVSFQLPGTIWFHCTTAVDGNIRAFSASSSGNNCTYLALFSDSTMIVTTGLKSEQLTNPSQCPAEQSQSQTQHMYWRLLLTPENASDPKLFTLQALSLSSL